MTVIQIALYHDLVNCNSGVEPFSVAVAVACVIVCAYIFPSTKFCAYVFIQVGYLIMYGVWR